jgi:hypothetical protein
MILNFDILCKVHFSFKKMEKINFENRLSKLFLLANTGTRSAATLRAATSALRLMCRTRVGRARRGAGVITGRCAASAWTPP